jgi:hypothetical protein
VFHLFHIPVQELTIIANSWTNESNDGELKESKGHTLFDSHGLAVRHDLRPDLANFMI